MADGGSTEDQWALAPAERELVIDEAPREPAWLRHPADVLP
jgi:hypothetical protein